MDFPCQFWVSFSLFYDNFEIFFFFFLEKKGSTNFWEESTITKGFHSSQQTML